MPVDPDCVFCKIAEGKIACHEVYRDENVLAFLDSGPLAPGHLLLVPLAHYATMDEAPSEIAAALGAVLPRLTKAVRQAVGAPGVNVLQNNGRCAGQEVEHLHVHLIPRTAGDGLGYRWNPTRYAEGQAESLCEQFRRVLKI